jgi:hypothetical protein
MIMGRTVLTAGMLLTLPLCSAKAETIVTYAYDAQGRLTQAKHDGGRNDDVQLDAGFDATDNRLQLTVTGRSKRPMIVVPLNGYPIIPLP